jgi:hypothetical protein
MARLADPRSSAGARGVERSETRMSGALSLWLLSLLREQRESNSPKGRNPEIKLIQLRRIEIAQRSNMLGIAAFNQSHQLTTSQPRINNFTSTSNSL